MRKQNTNLHATFVPSWFNQIKVGDTNTLGIFNDTDVVYSGHVADKQKFDVAIFRDGALVPPKSGQASHFLGLYRALELAGLRVCFFRCYRGWETLDAYSDANIKAFLINPDRFYSDANVICELLRRVGAKHAILDDPEVVTVQGPWLKALGVSVILDAPNIDFRLSDQYCDYNQADSERAMLLRASQIATTCWVKSDEDKRHYQAAAAFGAPVSSLPVCVTPPNFPPAEVRVFPEAYAAVFLGNLSYQPNRECLPFLNALANELQSELNFRLCVIGDGATQQMTDSFAQLEFLGLRFSPISVAEFDVGLCPLSHGAGMSVKILDYLHAGIPVISTRLGIRGYDPEILGIVLESELGEFVGEVSTLLATATKRSSMSLAGRKFANDHYGLKSLGERYAYELSGL